jgi:hypothetical protein
MSHHPPVFTHAADPLEAEDWLKTVLKMLTTYQCDDREKVLYAACDAPDFQPGSLTLMIRSTELTLVKQWST